MHTGVELANAIKQAIKKKMELLGITKKAIADHFGIKGSSLAGWEEKGSIDKEKLPELWRYFSDVVGMEHWGLSDQDFACFGLVKKSTLNEPQALYYSTRSKKINELIDACAGINDQGIAAITSYARFIEKDYPIIKANPAISSDSRRFDAEVG